MKLGAGWLYKDLTLPPDNHGVFVPRWSVFEQAEFPTRTEEYGFVTHVLERERRGVVLDAGAGFNRDIHLLPLMLGNMGFRVHALDTHPEVVHMPPHWNVFWSHGDMRFTILPDACVDYWICVSVLEHVDKLVRGQAFTEARRVLKPSGHVLLTTDETPPQEVNEWLALAGFVVGTAEDGVTSDLSPKVTWAIARKGEE